jgi:hypothetical protein
MRVAISIIFAQFRGQDDQKAFDMVLRNRFLPIIILALVEKNQLTVEPVYFPA